MYSVEVCKYKEREQGYFFFFPFLLFFFNNIPFHRFWLTDLNSPLPGDPIRENKLTTAENTPPDKRNHMHVSSMLWALCGLPALRLPRRSRKPYLSHPKRLGTDPPRSYGTDPPPLQTRYIQPPATSRSSTLFSHKQQEFSHFNIASRYIIFNTTYHG